MTIDRRFDVPAHVVSREVDGEIVLLNLETGLYFGLNEVGAVLWQHLLDGKPVRSALEEVVATFDVEPDVAEADLLALTRQLEEAALIEPTA